VVPDSREAYARLSQALAGNPTEQMTTVGISGTHGKTSVQWLLAGILDAAGVSCGVWGSLGRYDGSKAEDRCIERSSAAGIARWMQQSRGHGTTHLLVEGTSELLARRTLCGARLDVAVVTQVLRDPTSAYVARPAGDRIQQQLFPLLKPGAAVVLNADDPGSRAWTEKLDWPILSFGLSQPADVHGEIVECHAGEQTMLLHLGHHTCALQSTLLGEHHLQNCLAAAAAALALGISPAEIGRGLESVRGIPGRLERLDDGQPCPVYADVAPSPRALALTLSAVRRVTSGRLWCVMGSGAVDSAERARLGRVAERFADYCLLTSHRLDQKTTLAPLHDMLDGLLRPGRAHLLPDRIRAIAFALSQASPGDAIVLAGADVPMRNPASTPGWLGQRNVVRAWVEQGREVSP
jgi:UDP-N-acetylmuramoyl-L-alanyl-D-glutamate--2,6-diaminopimelate ligase